MTFALFLTLNLSLSIIAMLRVAGCVLIAHRLSDKLPVDAGWCDWGNALPVALVAQYHARSSGRQSSDAAAA
jgi:hypothetical protein